jgi:hypothetical protein
MQNLMVAQAEGFIRRYLELDIESNKPGGEQALEWFSIIEKALEDYRKNISDLESRIWQAKLTLGS